MASLTTAIFFAIVATIFAVSPAAGFTQQQWTDAYNMKELVFQDQVSIVVLVSVVAHAPRSSCALHHLSVAFVVAS